MVGAFLYLLQRSLHLWQPDESTLHRQLEALQFPPEESAQGLTYCHIFNSWLVGIQAKLHEALGTEGPGHMKISFKP